MSSSMLNECARMYAIAFNLPSHSLPGNLIRKIPSHTWSQASVQCMNAPETMLSQCRYAMEFPARRFQQAGS